MPDEAKKSIESVGAYLRSEITDPFMRVKAIHDFVATWVAYDAIGLADGSYKDIAKSRAPSSRRRECVLAMRYWSRRSRG